jgi:SAM-dependent methyltransferase
MTLGTDTGLVRRIRGGIAGGLLLPRVALLGMRAPRDRRVGWERYWGSIRATGAHGDVLWDASEFDEADFYRRVADEHLDVRLPLVDVGCGNSGYTRHLAPLFPATLGVDIAEHAVERARGESVGIAGLSYRAQDMTTSNAGSVIAREVGRDDGRGANVFIRGVLHILSRTERLALVANLRAIVGTHGSVLLAETNFPGNLMGYLRHLGASVHSIPPQLERAIHDLPAPGHFGAPERAAVFLAGQWRLVADGPCDIETIPLHDAADPEHIPGYFAVLAPRGHGVGSPS